MMKIRVMGLLPSFQSMDYSMPIGFKNALLVADDKQASS